MSMFFYHFTSGIYPRGIPTRKWHSNKILGDFLSHPSYVSEGLRWPDGKVLASGWRVPDLRPGSTKELLCKQAWCMLNRPGSNVLPLVLLQKLERVVMAQVLSLSSDNSSELRGLSQNNPQVVSKQDVQPGRKKIKQSQDSSISITESEYKTITKYEHISSIDSFMEDLVVVQISSSRILDSLPPPVWKKKYGT
ncbi:hypothetical protein AVEN_85953-1 [Araneus ventricosus]|uniref:Uncharacterized protein n=1 Tax=Araneus ventricosus TaxID=182803 RepID=A0A4Y2N1P3_ARAVE|nr:hypothetical protein AVEN_85953-1 [Araneus ventricosus]